MQVADNQRYFFMERWRVFTLLKIEHLQIRLETEPVKHNHLFISGLVWVIENFPDSFTGAPYSL